MVLARRQFTVTDDRGNVLPDALIAVQREEAGAPLATIYQDRDGTIPLGNPFSANAAPFASDGFVWFHAPAGAYRITVTQGSFSRTHRYVGVSLTSEQDSPPIGASWRFDGATANADPGAGLFRLSDADPASATAIHIGAEDKDGVNQGGWLETFDDGGQASERGILVLRSTDNATVLVARVTGDITANGSPLGYYSIPVTVLSASAAETFIAGAAFGLVFSRSGVDGQDGLDGADGSDGADGLFSGAEAQVTARRNDLVPLQDASDGDNPKRATAQSIAETGPVRVVLMPFGYDEDVETGDQAGGVFFFVPSDMDGYELTGVSARHLSAGSGSGDTLIQLCSSVGDMLSEVIHIESGALQSSGAATPPVIDTAQDHVNAGDSIFIDVDQLPDGTAPQGLAVALTFKKPVS